MRVFPAWYKPYGYNYDADGYLVLFYAICTIYGFSYFNDIKEQKGRKSRKPFTSELLTER